jgi:aryl-alcohol dehydrogenase-like predicted oxidoreductase
LDLFRETNDSTPRWNRLLSKPHVLQREKLEPLFKVLEEVAKAHKKTIAQVAINWLMNRNHFIIPIPGAKNGRQARENAGTLDWYLTEDEYARINQAEVAPH